MTTWLEPIAFFLLRIEGRSSGSIERGYSTWMNRSSAGARSRAPPQTMHAPTSSTTLWISLSLRSTGARASILSAVPAGEVMALEEDLGMVYPAAATIGTRRRVVLSPGTPPMLCLSRMGSLLKSIVLPLLTMALARASFSSMLIPWIWRAVTKEASSMSLRWFSTTSSTIVSIWEGTSFSPLSSPESSPGTLACPPS